MLKGATKSYRKIIFVSATKIGENTTVETVENADQHKAVLKKTMTS